MVPREVVIAEIDRSRIHPRRVAATAGLPSRETLVDSSRTARDLPPRDRIYGWIERARAEGVHFPFGEYNARIPRDFVERVMHGAATDVELPAPWSEHFRPAAEDDLLALLPGAE